MQEFTLTLPSGSTVGFYDSGTPAGAQSYKTIFAIHGYIFNAYTWKQMLSVAPSKNVRLVCINRPGYGKSTPVAQEKIPTPGGEYKELLQEMSIDILEFIHAFYKKENLSGDIGILGWSLGSMLANSVVANIANAREEVQGTLKSLKALIHHEPGEVALGLPVPKQYFHFTVPTLLPQSEATPFFQFWISGYFDHTAAALSAKDMSTPNLVTGSPSTSTPPTIYSVKDEQDRKKLFEEQGGPTSDLMFMLSVIQNEEVVNQYYRKAAFETKAVKVLFICGDRTPEQMVLTAWQAEKDGGKVDWMNGANHLSQWDMPEETLNAYLAAF
ncbi:Alpha/Beta hydrolase protein [Flagelloscypha sp. PMI_526]|nr:Alpha/Beta hydrolase protein [Flagelloscypha sp. PMI_526]